MMTPRTLRPRDTEARAVWLVALCLAAAIGVISAISPSLAVAALVAAVVVPAAVLRPKVVVYLLAVTVFTQAITVGGVPVSRLAAPIGLIALVSELVNAPVSLRESTRLLVMVGAYTMLAVASLAWTVSVPGTETGLASLAISLVYMGAFATLVRDRIDLRRVLTILVGSGMALALFWLVQFGQGVDRTENLAGDPNFVAAFLVLSLPIALVLASSASTTGRRLFVYGGIAVQAAAIIATLSRSGLGALIVAVALTMVLPVRTLQLSQFQKAAFLLSAVVGLAIILPVAGPQLAERFRQADKQESVVGARGDLWRSALHAYRQHEVTGIGYGGYEAESFQLLSETPGVNLASHLRFMNEGEPVHNAYLETLTDIGPLGLLLFLGIIADTAWSLRRVARRAQAAGDAFVRAVSNALLIGLISYSLSSVLLSTETSRALWMIVGLRLALPAILTRQIRSSEAADG